MRIKVQKYGGSSVADRSKLVHVARRIVDAHRSGYAVVTVVSAMGDTTEELLSLARALSRDPDHRELDMLLSAGERISTALLALAVQDQGAPAISLTGAQSGIITTDRHFNADIASVRPERIQRELEAGKVVIVAGYQGASPTGETTTLGRGGSDTSAVALAAALDAQRCEIFSDVDGIFTADPRIVEEARPLKVIGCEEMLELARHGATVLNLDAVRLASELGVTLRAASTFSDNPGTIVTPRQADRDTDPEFRGVACHRELIRVAMPPSGSLRDEVLEAGGRPDVYLDGNFDGERHEVLVRAENVGDAGAFTETIDREFGAHVDVELGIGSVSAVGWGVGRAHDTKRSFDQLWRKLSPADEGADDHRVASDHALTCLVDGEQVVATTRALHGGLLESASLGSISESVGA